MPQKESHGVRLDIGRVEQAVDFDAGWLLQVVGFPKPALQNPLRPIERSIVAQLLKTKQLSSGRKNVLHELLEIVGWSWC